MSDMKWYRQHLIKACPPIGDKAWNPGEGPGHPWSSGVVFQIMQSDWRQFDRPADSGHEDPLGRLLQ